ncbi:MAG: hypothetical protein GX465_18180 [Acidobacteria bacterium]|nr:hypothetical protein [Acidobacteriota bacterium]
MVAAFVKAHFPEIRTSPARIKMNLWRYRKSGVEAKLDDEILGRRLKRYSKRADGDEPWLTVRLAQGIADKFYSRPEKSVSQRELQRMTHVSVDQIEALRGWLLLNYGIEARAGRRKGQVVYRGRMKDSRGRILRVGVDLPALGAPSAPVKGIDHRAIEKAISQGYEPGRQIFIAYCPGAPKSWAKEYWTIVVKDPIFLDWALDRLATSGGKAFDGLALKPGASTPCLGRKGRPK